MEKLGRRVRRACTIVPFILLTTIACSRNMIDARYYQLLESERPRYIGLRSIDSLAGRDFMMLESATERSRFYDSYWEYRSEERREFEERIAYAMREYGFQAPLSDERVSIYIRHGIPSRRQIVTPVKVVGVESREAVNPVEIWTYRGAGVEYDLMRLGRAYRIIATSWFGDKVTVPYLVRDTLLTTGSRDSTGSLDHEVAYGRFRQKRNLTRLELYFQVFMPDTAQRVVRRQVEVYLPSDSLVTQTVQLLRPRNQASGWFFDQENLWLEPRVYRVVVTLQDLSDGRTSRRELEVDLMAYHNDAKEISDLIGAQLIDESSTDEKFQKGLWRVIPRPRNESPQRVPFYFYHEVYNLQTDDGNHQLRTSYEIYNKERMRKEIVDMLVQDDIGDGDVAYLSAKYHPTDLPVGEYMIVARDRDLLSGIERTTVSEFTLLPPP